MNNKSLKGHEIFDGPEHFLGSRLTISSDLNCKYQVSFTFGPFTETPRPFNGCMCWVPLKFFYGFFLMLPRHPHPG